MDLYKQILRKSKAVDNKFDRITYKKLTSLNVIFKTPKNHPRFNVVKNYELSFLPLENIVRKKFDKELIFIVDKNVSQIYFVQSFMKKIKKRIVILPSIENKIKNKLFLDRLLRKNKFYNSTFVVVGGGLLCNCGAYLAEQTKSDYVLFPTTVLSMADGALGGKVRANLVTNNIYKKHYYKEYYEPNAIFIDLRFINLLPERQIKIGLVEIIKHSLFQSPSLYIFLTKFRNSLLKNKELLLKAILWNAELKRTCLEVDPYETINGSKIILRGGHDFSDKVEENNKLQIPHGIAVAIGIVQQLEIEQNNVLLTKAKKIFNLFGIPYTFEDYNSWK